MNAATVDSLPGQVVTIRNKTSNATLVNISGKGKLHYVACNLLNAGGRYKIEIDGQTFYAKNAHSSVAACGYFAKEAALQINAQQGTSLTVAVALPTADNMLNLNMYSFASSPSSFIPIAELSDDVFGKPSSDIITGVFYSKKPLRFDQSLKITIEGEPNSSSGPGYNYIKYTLDD